MRNRYFYILFFFSITMCFSSSAHAQTLTFEKNIKSNHSPKREMFLQDGTFIYDALAGKQESRKLTNCQRSHFQQVIKKLLKIPSNKCKDPTESIKVSFEAIERTIFNCRSLLPSFEKTLTDVLNCKQ